MRKTIPDLPFKRRLILAVPQKQSTGLRNALGRETFYVAAYEMYKKYGFTEKSINMELL